MAKVMTYTQEEMEELTKKGYWQTATFADVWDRNARECPDKEALVDSKTRLSWADEVRPQGFEGVPCPGKPMGSDHLEDASGWTPIRSSLISKGRGQEGGSLTDVCPSEAKTT